MKQTIIVFVVMLLGVSTAFAGVKLVKGEQFARIPTSTGEDIIISKVLDGKTTCYVSMYGKYGSQSISCVK